MKSPDNWISLFFFFNDTATTEIYTLSLHDALPIYRRRARQGRRDTRVLQHVPPPGRAHRQGRQDRKSTRLNSSHSQISYAVFCLKKKKKHYSRATNLFRYDVSTRTVAYCRELHIRD